MPKCPACQKSLFLRRVPTGESPELVKKWELAPLCSVCPFCETWLRRNRWPSAIPFAVLIVLVGSGTMPRLESVYGFGITLAILLAILLLTSVIADLLLVYTIETRA